MSIKKGIVYSFNERGTLLALADDDGIIRIWETTANVLKQECTPSMHTTGTCSALAWLSERKANSKFLAIGTTKGQIALYSYVEGKIVQHFAGEGHNGKITALACNTNAGHLYSCGRDGLVIVWSTKQRQRLSSFNVGPEPPQRLVFDKASGGLAVASRQIKVYTPAGQLLETFAGHSSPINCLSSFTAPDGTAYLVSGSIMEWDVRVWCRSGKGRNKTAACSLLMDDSTSSLACGVLPNGKLQLTGVTSRGQLKLFQLEAASLTGAKVVSPTTTFSLLTEQQPAQALQFVLAHFSASSCHPDQLLVAYGDKRTLSLEWLAPNCAQSQNQLTRADPLKAIAPKRKRADAQLDATTATKSALPIYEAGEMQYKSSLVIPRRSAVLQHEVPMEARLLNLEIASGQLAPQSKAHLLQQAMISNDTELLHSVLRIKDEKVVRLTLERLPVPFVVQLLNELLHLMRQKRRDVESAVRWFKTLASVHASQLCSVGGDALREQFKTPLPVTCSTDITHLGVRLNRLVRRIRNNTELDNLPHRANVLIFKDDHVENEFTALDEENCLLSTTPVENGEASSDAEMEMDVDGNKDDADLDDIIEKSCSSTQYTTI